MSLQPTLVAAPAPTPCRALPAGWTYWLSMFAASVLGTNLGDFWVDGLALGRPTSFASLAAICGLAIWADRHTAGRTEAYYWIAIVALRAAATNLGDTLTHDLRLGYLAVTLVLGALALLAARATRPPQPGAGSPVVDGWYWVAMLVAGIFGTTGGDLSSHTFGLHPAAILLPAILLAALALRGALFPAALPAYWCAILAERAAGTPVGDSLAHAIGLTQATGTTLLLFVATIAVRRYAGQRAIGGVLPAENRRGARDLVSLSVPLHTARSDTEGTRKADG